MRVDVKGRCLCSTFKTVAKKEKGCKACVNASGLQSTIGRGTWLTQWIMHVKVERLL